MDIQVDTTVITVLLIEDNPGDRLLINEQLREGTQFSRFSVKSCSSLAEGISLIKEEKIAVIILDLGLPDSTGLDSLRKIKELDDSIPVVVLTIDSSDLVGLKAIQCGAQDYLAKDEVQPKYLTRVIEYAVNRNELEQKLKDSLNLYTNTFEQAAVGMLHLSTNTAFIKVNKKFCSITGYSEYELSGKSIIDITFPDDLEKDLMNFEKLISGEIKSYSLEKRFVHKNGSLVWTNVTRTAIFNNQDEIKFVFTTVEDITYRKSLALELQQQKDLLLGIFDILPVGISILNSEGKLISNNKKHEDIWAGSEYNGIADHKKYKAWRAESGEEITSEEWASYRALTKKEISIGEVLEIQCFDGSRKTILNSAIPLVKDGNVLAVVVAVEDITAMVEAEHKLKRLIVEKEILVKESNHRIKNNLQLMASLINLQLVNTKDKKIQSILSDSRNRLNSVSFLHDYLYRSSDLNEVNVQTYLYKIIDHIRSINDYDARKIKILKDIDDFTINSSLAISIGLIINELVTNAVKYAFKNKEKGLISIELKKEDKNISLNLKDNGIGLPEKINFPKAKTLGFQIVYAMISQHSGSIEYKDNEGAEFIIKLSLK